MKKQTRNTIITGSPAVRAESIDGKMYFKGYAAVYNTRSRMIFERGKMFYEILLPGCFDRVLADPSIDVVLSLDHNHFYNLGRTVSGNLLLRSDETGLYFEASVPDTNLGRDTFEMVLRGDFTDMSFMFSVNASGETWERDGDGNLIHYVKEVSGLYDVTICTLRGAYAETIVDVEVAARMFSELQIREGEDTSEEETGGETAGETGSEEDQNETSEEDDDDEPAEDLDQMLIELHKTGTGSSL